MAIMKEQQHWRHQSLATLENHDWGDLATAPTALVKRCMELSRIPVADFTLGDLRVMIGQLFGLQYLVPLALEKMRGDIFIEAELYPADLLSSLLQIDTTFWESHPLLWTDLHVLLHDKRQQLAEMKLDTAKFDVAYFPTTHNKNRKQR